MDEYGVEPKKRSNTKVAIGVVLGLVILCCVITVVCVGGTVGVAFTAMRQSEPYLVGVERATTNTAVIEALGAPVEPSFFFTGAVNQDMEGGTAVFEVPLTGSNASGTLYVDAVLQRGNWVYNVLEVQTPAGLVDLRE